MTEAKTLFLNADDFGASEGVNRAIIKATTEGALNSTSIMVNMPASTEAITAAKTLPISCGLHINLTAGRPISDTEDVDLLVNKNGKFKRGFLSLFLLSFFRPNAVAPQIELEIRNQLDKLYNAGIKIDHMDGHRHIHTIPLIWKIIMDLQIEYGIPHIRIINESFISTVFHNKNFAYLINGGLIKYLLLRTFAFVNDVPSSVYFYSVLFTGKISKARVKGLRIPSRFESAEIMLHPSLSDYDVNTTDLERHYFSRDRKMEFDTAMDKELFSNFTLPRPATQNPNPNPTQNNENSNPYEQPSSPIF